jgi:hypothetical protein
VPKQSLPWQVRLGHIYCFLEVTHAIKLRQLQRREKTHHGRYQGEVKVRVPAREVAGTKGFLRRWIKGRNVWVEVPAHADMGNLAEVVEVLGIAREVGMAIQMPHKVYPGIKRMIVLKWSN